MIEPKALSNIVDSVLALDLDELREARATTQAMCERAEMTDRAAHGLEWSLPLLKVALQSTDALIAYRERLEEIAGPIREAFGGFISNA